MVLVISVRHTHSGLKQLLAPAALAWPLNCVVFGKQMPEKKMLKKFPLFNLFSRVLGDSDPTGQLSGFVPLPEKPLCTLTAAQRFGDS